jgi:hypothetical protein
VFPGAAGRPRVNVRRRVGAMAAIAAPSEAGVAGSGAAVGSWGICIVKLSALLPVSHVHTCYKCPEPLLSRFPREYHFRLIAALEPPFLHFVALGHADAGLYRPGYKSAPALPWTVRSDLYRGRIVSGFDITAWRFCSAVAGHFDITQAVDHGGPAGADQGGGFVFRYDRGALDGGPGG